MRDLLCLHENCIASSMVYQHAVGMAQYPQGFFGYSTLISSPKPDENLSPSLGQ